jgi:hypothetical protein
MFIMFIIFLYIIFNFLLILEALILEVYYILNNINLLLLYLCIHKLIIFLLNFNLIPYIYVNNI